MTANYLIIGAGYSGLQLARGLLARQTPPASVKLLEKSKGVGGRLATRREGQFTFDHGAQFIKHCPLNSAQIQSWKSEGLLNLLNNDSYTAFGGMTRIAKKLAENIEIHFERKVLKIQKVGELWSTTDDRGDSYQTENLILSCPLPQSLEILRNSDIHYDAALDTVAYAKAIVFLVQDDRTLEPMESYREFPSSNVFSVTSQFKKGTSILPCWTVTMTPDWSARFFEYTDAEILKAAWSEIQSLIPHTSSEAITVKKWRYSHPLATHTALYAEPAPKLYLIGDAFGGPSLNGAHRSSHALLGHLGSLSASTPRENHQNSGDQKSPPGGQFP